MGVNSSLEYGSSFDTYIIREYLGKPLMLTKRDKFYDYKYKKEQIRLKLNNFFRFSIFWERYFKERIGRELESSDWKIYTLVIFQQKPLMQLIKRVNYNDRKNRNIFRALI